MKIAQLSFLLGLFATILFTSCGGNEPDPVVLPKISISDVTFFEGADGAGNSFSFQITLDKSPEEAASVRVKTTDMEATAGDDFVALDEVVQFGIGQSIGTVSVSIIGDSLREGDERFTLTLLDPVNAVVSSASATGTGTIRNDDTYLAIDDVGYSTPLSYPGLTLVWSDEFDGNALNASDWTYEIGDGCPSLCGWGNNESQYYTNSTNNLFFSDGFMVIEAQEQGIGSSDYTSSRIITRDKQHFKYGRIDIRAKLPEGQGIWPALWMLPQDNVYGGWPNSGEIDIMEMVGHLPSLVHATVHYDGGFGHQFTGQAHAVTGTGSYQDEFHVFSLEWEEDEMRFYMDDEHYFTFGAADFTGANYPFNEEFFFVMNLAVGGNWPGYPDDSTLFPQRMVVDYVRVFQ